MLIGFIGLLYYIVLTIYEITINHILLIGY